MKKKSETLFVITLLAPAFALVGFVILYPMLQAIYLSFTNYSMLNPTIKWVGLNNYLTLYKNPVFWESASNTVIIASVSVIFQLLLGLVIALMLNQKIKGRNFFRGLVLIIWVIPMVVVSLLWMWIFDSQFGIFNYILMTIGLISKNIAWLSQPVFAKFAVIMTLIWRGIPFMMVMLLAGLQTIPDEIVEAAEIDGANVVSKFKHITIPYLIPIAMIAGLLSMIRLFQEFDTIFILTNGGPLYDTTTLSINVYKTAFDTYDMGKASAMGVTWLLLLGVFATFYSRALQKKVF